RRKTASAVIVAVGALATLATSYSEPEVDAGFTDIAVLDDRVFIGVGSPGGDIRGYPYISKDGGLSWGASRATDLPAPDASSVVRTQGPLCLRDQAQHCFRIDGGSSVYESTDSGVTWSVGWQPPPGREGFLERYGTSLDRYAITSWDLSVVGSSGNTVLIAMGDDGLLRRTSDGTWTRDVVGTAKPIAEAWANIAVELLAVVVVAVLALAAASLLGRRLINVPESFSVFVRIGLLVLLLTALIVGRVLGTDSGSSAIQYVVILGPVGGWFGLAAVAAIWAKTLRVDLALGRRLLAYSSIAIAIGSIAATGAFYAWSAGWIAHWSVALVVASGAGIVTLGLGARSMMAVAASSPRENDRPGPSVAQEPDEAVDVHPSAPSQWQRREGLRRWTAAIMLAVSSPFLVLGAATVVMLIPAYLSARWTGHRSPLARAMVAVGLLVVIPPILPFFSVEAAIDSLTGAARNPPTAITLPGAHVLLIGGAFAALLKAPNRRAARARIVLLTAVYILAAATSSVGYILLYLLPLAIVAIDGLASRGGQSEPSTADRLASTE
ncbi:MAG: hypothetical protein GWP18_01540, partial [Proteobacteria bacterium]|nr:hypothetical protein [Pseudomonadota bacterium]